MVNVPGEINDYLKAFEDDESVILKINDFAVKNLRSRPELVAIVLARALETAQRRTFEDARAWILFWFGWHRSDRSQFAEASRFFTEAYALFDEQKDRNGILKTCNALAAAQRNAGDIQSGIEWILRGLEVAEDLGNFALKATLLCNLGECYIETRHYAEAEQALQEAMRLDASEQTFTAINLALAQLRMDQGDYSSALPLVKVAFNHVENLDAPTFVAECHAKSAQAMHGIGWDDDAEESYRQAIEIVERFGDRRNLAEYLDLFGRFEMDRGNAEMGRIRLERALDVCLAVDSPQLESKIRLSLHKCYKKTGAVEKSLEALERHVEIKERLRADDIERTVTRSKADRARKQLSMYKTRYDQIGAISRIGQDITSTLDPERMLATVYESVNHLMDAAGFGVAVLERPSGAVKFLLFMEKGVQMEVPTGHIDNENSLMSACIRDGGDMFFDDIVMEMHRYIANPSYAMKTGLAGSEMLSALFVPLKLRRETIGAITVQSYNRNAYNRQDLEALRALASYVAIAIENSRLFEEVNHMATFDSLTALLNRRRLFEYGSKEFYKHKRYGAKLGILMIDIDHFKNVNDSFGHDAGDRVLVMLADSIREIIRLSDIAGRYGGEEFVIVLPDTDSAGAVALAERIRQRVENKRIPLDAPNGSTITISIGAHAFDDGDSTFENGVMAADANMYKAKTAGRNRVRGDA